MNQVGAEAAEEVSRTFLCLADLVSSRQARPLSPHLSILITLFTSELHQRRVCEAGGVVSV